MITGNDLLLILLAVALLPNEQKKLKRKRAKKGFLKPYNERELNPERSNYNKRLSRARRIIENVFGILANRFRINHTEIGISVA
nr:unnamed protein product [Callosobruchus analis]